jgi:hypothetical protein
MCYNAGVVVLNSRNRRIVHRSRFVKFCHQNDRSFNLTHQLQVVGGEQLHRVEQDRPEPERPGVNIII